MDLKHLILIIILAFLVQSCQTPSEKSSEQEPTRMNVLFIVVDDLRPELSSYGHSVIKSPNIDKLAANGLLFERAYCQQAVCAPSRISLLSGLRPDSTHVYGLRTRLTEARHEAVSLPRHFRQNGYQTVSIGKIYHHQDDDAEGWSKEPMRPRSGEGRGYLTEAAIQEMKAYAEADPSKAGRGPAYESADTTDEAYSDGLNAKLAIEELNRLKDSAFFLAVGFYKPHLPFNAPQKYWNMYPEEEVQLAENPFAPENATEYSLTNFGELRNYSNMPKGDEPISEEQAMMLNRGYRACVSYTDAQIGRVIDELDRLGLRENTIIILWGDHGFKLGEHNSWCKHTNFEIDTHVPLIISVPGKEKGQRTKALTEFVDIYPSLSELCGLEAPKQQQGISFAPLLENPDRPWKKAAFSQYPRARWIPEESTFDMEGMIMGYSMRTDRFHYIEWTHLETGEIEARELYDHENDPQENKNVADNPDYAATVEKLSDMLSQGWRGALPDNVEI